MDEYSEELKSIENKILKTRKLFYEKQNEIFKKQQLSGTAVRNFRDSFPKDLEGKSTFDGWKFD